MTSILKHEIVVENYFDFQCNHTLPPCPKQASVCSLPGIAFMSSHCRQTREFVHFATKVDAKLKSNDSGHRLLIDKMLSKILHKCLCRPSIFKYKPMQTYSSGMADPGFYRGASNSQSGCANLLFCNFFAENYMKMKEIASRGGMLPWSPPP